MSTESEHKITDDQNLLNFHVYILKRDRYFGYDTIGGGKLKEYTLADVAKKVEDAFGGSNRVFLDSTINANTTFVVVPDNWDSQLPAMTEMFLDKIHIIPFVFFLHPGIKAKQLNSTKAPADAAYRFEFAKLQTAKSGRNIEPGYIQAIQSSPSQIEALLRRYGGNFSMNNFNIQAYAPDMEVTQQPIPRTQRRSFDRRPSITRANSKNRRHELTKPTWVGQMESMETMSYEDAQHTLGLAPGEKADYKKAWDVVRSRVE